MTLEASLEYERTPLLLSLISNKDHKMNKANKTIFPNTSLEVLTDQLDLTVQSGSGWWMVSLHGEVETRTYLAGDC